jgi:hypothetical protein
MGPRGSLDNFRRREIEQQLVAELQVAREQVRTATTPDEQRTASELFSRALQRFTDFVNGKIVPEEFLRD